jgi:tetratricopeptide (TPR) repeat protein
MTSPPEQSQNTSSTALCSDGEKLLLQGRYEDGATSFSKALALDPSNTAAMVGYAKALIDGYSDFDQAEDLYQRALVVDPTDVLTMRLLANLKRYARKDYENAEEYFRNALVIDPYCPDTLRDYADFKAWRGDEKGALTLCRRILQGDPDNALAESEVQRLRNIITGK